MNISDVIDAINVFKEWINGLPKIYKRPLTVFVTLLFLFPFSITYLKYSKSILITYLIILIILAIYTCVVFGYHQLYVKSFRRQVNEMKRKSSNPIELWKVYKDAQITKFFPKQRDQYYKECSNLMIQLGDLPKAEKYIELIHEKSSNFKNMYYQYVELINGNTIDESLNKAHNTVFQDNERQIEIVMTLNKGVYYTEKQNYLNAQACYKECIRLIDKYGDKNNLLPLVYGNYVKNSAEGKNIAVSDCQKVIDEYEKRIDRENVNEYLTFANDVMVAYRKMCVPLEEMNRLFEQVVKHVNELKLTDEQSLLFNISCIRIAIDEGINSAPYLDEVLEKRSCINELKMPARFEAYKSLDQDFHFIHFPDKYKDLIEQVKVYLNHKVIEDLNEYLSQLPEEAVYKKGYMILQKATVSLNLQKEGINAFKSIVGNAITLYHDHLLKGRELNTYLFILRQMSLSEHCDESILFQDQKYATLIINKVIEMLRDIKDKNVLAPTYLQLSFFYTCLNDLENCYKYYRLFQKCDCSLRQYNIETRGLFKLADLLSKVLVFMHAVELVTQRVDLKNEPESIQQWFKNCLYSDGFILSVLLGHYLSYEQIEIHGVSTGDDKDAPKWFHTWLVCNDIEIDCTLKQFKNEEGNDRIYFASGTHPFKKVTSHILNLIAKNNALFGHENTVSYDNVIKLYPDAKRINSLIYEQIKNAKESLDEKVGVDEE